MSITDEKLAALIPRLEEFARRKPASYRLRVALLAILGYAYLFAVVVLLLLLVYWVLAYVRINYLTIKVVWIPLVLAWVVLRSMWVTLPAPDGSELTREQAPQLFELADELQKALSGPKAHHILLSDEFNAAVVEIPRFGMFGWAINYLVVGLPLLHGLTAEEFRAVLAHEYGHLSGKHGRFFGWIYRLRRSWIEVLTRVHQERHYAAFIFEPFLNWYAPFFNAYSFVLARAQEHEADGYAVDLAGKDVTTRMLVKFATRDRLLGDEFWPEFYRLAIKESNPPPDPFSQMLKSIQGDVEDHKNTKWVLQALRAKTDYNDTHPALADRLAGLGYSREEVEAVALQETRTAAIGSVSNAADYYVRDLPADFVSRFDRLWKEQISATWRAQHQEAQTSQKRLRELETAERARSLTTAELWERAQLVSYVHDSKAALPLVKAVLNASPEHLEANLALGGMLLKQRDAAGMAYLEKAMSLSADTTPTACYLAYDFHLEQGSLKDAETYRTRGETYQQNLHKIYDAALNFSPGDRYEPHGLDESEVENLRAQLSHVRGLGRTYLVCKVIEGASEPWYVIGVFASYTWREGQNEKHAGALVDELSNNIVFPHQCIYVSLDQYQYLVNKFEAIPGSLLLVGGDETASC
jgi:Zn-dependent protease with chaperone function